jgi:DNA replication protein DnaC
MTGAEAIKVMGEKLTKDFDINSEPRLSIYRKVYENFMIGLEEGINNKGVMLIGDIGVGKSMLMKIMQKLFCESRREFKWFNCREISDLLECFTVIEIKEYYGKSCKMDLYIDDIGVGNSIHNKYGNTTNIIADILMERSELFVSEGFKTHVSSNKPTSLDKEKYPNIVTLENLYGDRIIDRLHEMCEIITWKGKSLRKQ